MENKKIKEKCPECGSGAIIRKGRRKEKFETVQKYFCRDCGNNFSSKKLKNSSFSPKVIISAINYYNKGMTLSEVSKMINKRFGVRTYPRLISFWIKRRERVIPYKRIREQEGKAKEELIVRKMFVHKQPYMFKYHKQKVEKFLTDYFFGLKSYFNELHRTCPNDVFNSDNGAARCSQIDLGVEPHISRRRNYACRAAGFALKGAGANRERHDMIEEFFISNDTATIAVEIPVWIFPNEVPDEARGAFGIDKPLTGHIDILQARYGIIYILDYKPGADKVNAISQLFSYAMALSVRTGIWLRNFKCAWFDEKNYFEFNPSEIVLSSLRKSFNKNAGLVLRKYLQDEEARDYYTGREFHEKRRKDVDFGIANNEVEDEK